MTKSVMRRLFLLSTTFVLLFVVSQLNLCRSFILETNGFSQGIGASLWKKQDASTARRGRQCVTFLEATKEATLNENQRQIVLLERPSVPGQDDDDSANIPCSVIRGKSRPASPRSWKHFVPTYQESLFSDGRGVDIRVQWDTELETCDEVARMWVDRLFGERGATTKMNQSTIFGMKQELTSSLQYFVDYCQKHLVLPLPAVDKETPQPQSEAIKHSNNQNLWQAPTKFQGRIVASRGIKASTKCPQWHLDHVPIRWIQSLVGPGVDFVPGDEHGNSQIRWENINALNQVEGLSVKERNQLLVDDTIKHLIQHAEEGEAVMLVGKAWNEWTRSNENVQLAPVVHKSPEVQPFQGRVLLTMDIQHSD